MRRTAWSVRAKSGTLRQHGAPHSRTGRRFQSEGIAISSSRHAGSDAASDRVELARPAQLCLREARATSSLTASISRANAVSIRCDSETEIRGARLSYVEFLLTLPQDLRLLARPRLASQPSRGAIEHVLRLRTQFPFLDRALRDVDKDSPERAMNRISFRLVADGLDRCATSVEAHAFLQKILALPIPQAPRLHIWAWSVLGLDPSLVQHELREALRGSSVDKQTLADATRVLRVVSDQAVCERIAVPASALLSRLCKLASRALR